MSGHSIVGCRLEAGRLCCNPYTLTPKGVALSFFLATPEPSPLCSKASTRWC